MKLSKYIFIPLLLTLGACKDYLDVNVTPNNPTVVTPQVLLPTGLAGSAFANANELNRFGSVIVNHLAGTGNSSPANYDVYNINGADFGNQWRFEIYGGALVNYDKLIEAAERVDARSYIGIAKIMKAYTFSIATDTWGDVPYSQALKGEALLQPRLDKQEDIYKGNPALGIQSLFDLVREGLADLDAAGNIKPGADDIVYGGNLDNWKRAGNTILLKFAMQISQVEPQLATSVINEVLAKGSSAYIVSNEQDLNVKFGGSVGSFSPIHTYTNVSAFRTDMMLSTRFLNVLRPVEEDGTTIIPARTDPRLPLFFTKPAADYVTIDNGFRGTLPTPITTWSQFNKYVTGVNGEGPVRLVTNFQRAFILAEAAIRFGTAGDPQALYTEGITQSMKLAGVSDVAIDAYLTANPEVAVLTGTDEEKLKQVLTQKWIAWTGNGLEAWNDWRRTGYPELPPSQNAAGIDATRPVRAQYITQEIERNPNFPNPGPLSNERVWWDIN